MGRIRGVPGRRANPLARLGYWFSRRRVGKVAEPLAVSTSHPRMTLCYSNFELAVERFRLVDARLKGLASIKAASLVGCPW